MKHTISEDRRILTIRVDDAEEQAELRNMREEEERWGTTWMECEALDRMLANCELQWVYPEDTGDLTDAPLLGIWGGEEPLSRERVGPHGAVHVGGDGGGPWYCPILERWGFAHYQLRSFLEDLTDTGEVQFVDRW